MTGSESVPSSGVDSRLVVAIDAWKRKLLDLSKRNRALNFRPTKVSTVTIVDEQPAEVFRCLYLRKQPMKFSAAPVPRRSVAGAPNPLNLDEELLANSPLEDELEGISSADYVPYDRADLDTHHTDDVLQTAATPEKLDQSLRRLEELARSTIEEQGVNTLFLALGMLQYQEAEYSEAIFKAPLILLPVELRRKSARAGFVLQAGEDDPIVNPALAEYLRRAVGIETPDFPDIGTLTEDYDLQDFLIAFQARIADFPGWAIKNDIVLGQFSFQKFVMYKDLEAHGPALAAHPLIRQLVCRSGETLVGLPDDVRDMPLDRDFAPEQTFHVVDADSSQLRALAAVARGYNLVLEGPPGTGKSQTITNLIAQALAAGKSVLFVAEKMAALEVVHRRLQATGLGEFCLELHSTKANKRHVMRDIAAALDASLQRPVVPTASTQRLPEVRTTLTEYVSALHTPYGALGLSPYQAYGELGQVRDAPKVRLTRSIDDVTRTQLQQTVRDLEDLAAAALAVGNLAEHPWRDCSKTFFSEADLDAIGDTVHALRAQLDDILQRAAAVQEIFQLPPVRTFGDIETAAAVAVVLARSPGAPLRVLQNEAWNTPPPEARMIVDRGRKITALKQFIQERFAPAVLETEHAQDIAYVEKKSRGFLSVLAILDRRYRAIRKRWRSYRLPSYQPSWNEQAADMKKVDELRREQTRLAAQEALARELFGALWEGENSCWDALDGYIRWVVEFRGLCVRHGLSQRTVEIAANRAPNVSAVTELKEVAATALSLLASLREMMGWPTDYLTQAPIEEIRDRMRALENGLRLGPRWAAFESARQQVAAGLAAEALATAFTGAIAFSDLPRAFLRAFYQKWLTTVVQERAPLRTFHAMTHEQRVAEFQALDRRVLEENRAALVARLRDRVQERLRAPAAAQAMPFLRWELARQRGHSPLRKTLQRAGAAIRAIKPCFLMSPLTVAQYLKGTEPSFDLVVFDEASQLPPEDAVGAILRGKQLVVVGDPKQLPPTNFFAVMGGQVAPVYDENGEPLFEDSESILEEFMAAGTPTHRLKWHYRSAHESLITFSNIKFYDAELHTFPSVETDSQAIGLQFEYVPEGVYEGNGLNRAEARRVADAVVQHAKTHPELSLGVGTFNLRQQLAILDELEQRRRDDPSLESFLAPKEQEGFFVKNLENIQGDERDVIFLSVTYAKGRDGKLRYQFGPLNAQNGWRRLNVLTTRARKCMRVFSSIRSDDINVSMTESLGAKLLHDFLAYAERGSLNHPSVGAAARTESPFEREVFFELTRRGLTLIPQVGMAGYRIDFGVLDDAYPGRYVCGIECDGVTYHSSETARDRDRLRQQVLESRGWILHRIWSTDWFKDREGQIERILRLVEESKRRRLEEIQENGWSLPTVVPTEDENLADNDGLPEKGDGEEPSDPFIGSIRRAESYARPTAPPYRVTPGKGRYAKQDILAATKDRLLQAILAVVETEAPLHVSDLVSRVAGMWGNRAGTRITTRILEVCREAERHGQLARRGDFVWASSGHVRVRSRAGLRVSAERICPEEYREAVLQILRTGHTFPRQELVIEVRALLGCTRSRAIDAAIDKAIDGLIKDGVAGQGSLGIVLRR